MIDVVFYIAYPYYFPHFLPISRELIKKGKKVKYILTTKQNSKLLKNIADDENLDYLWGEEKLFDLEAKYFFFANIIDNMTEIKGTRIFLDHGVGTKQCDYKGALELNDVVFVEGDYRFDSLNLEFPQFKDKIKKIGFSKLDLVLNQSEKVKEEFISKYNLDKNKKTLLYAPTFFPSSIEKMSDKFPTDFEEFNLIVKPHYMSLSRSRYKSQQRKFKIWESYKNCVVCGVDEYSLVPFLIIADIMISDESSAIFEFTALDKPVILNRFLKLRWSYYLNPWKLMKRLDQNIEIYRKIGDNAKNYKEMVKMVKGNSQNPNKLKDIRAKYTKAICGKVDGKVSQRIIEFLNLN